MSASLKFLFGFILIHCYYSQVESQICTRNKQNIVTLTEKRTYTMIESYKKPNCHIFCNRRRIKTLYNIITLTERKNFVESFCCEGYQQHTTSTDNFLCTPTCEKGCENGRCVAPNNCECNFGYKMSTKKTCDPYCSSGCPNGVCTRPNICTCKAGYKMSSDFTCDPVCSSDCSNGICSSPNICTCKAGYKMSSDLTCDPVCANSCSNGICTSPNICACKDGYKMSSDLNCDPVCTSGCPNGICTSPNNCTCKEGYKMSSNLTCDPVCASGCQNGICTSPNTCTCKAGYNMTSDFKCDPVCVSGCVCIGPDICKCNMGYELNSTINSCLPKCIQCKGNCIAPNVCVCISPYLEKINAIIEKYCSHVNGTEAKCNSSTCIIENMPKSVPDVGATLSSNYNYTIEENEAFLRTTESDDTVSIENNTSSNSYFTTDLYSEGGVTEESPFDDIYSLNNTTNKKEISNFTWIFYAAGVVLIVLIILLIVLYVRKNWLLKQLKRNNFETGVAAHDNDVIPNISFGPVITEYSCTSYDVALRELPP